MPDKWPLANGNWSNAANWNGGTKPVAGDDVFADGFTVTIDENVTVASIRTTQRSGGTVGGGFTLNAGRIVSATGTGFISSTSTCITFSASGSPSVLNGNCTSDGSGSVVFHNNSGNTLTINGNISNPTFTGRTVDTNTNTTTIINGNILGGTSGDSVRANGNALCVLAINGNIFGPTGTNFGIVCVRLNGTSQGTIVGNVNAGTSSGGIAVFLEGTNPGPTLTVTGNVNGNTVPGNGGNSALAITPNGGQSGTVTINGNVTGGSISSGSGCIGLSTNNGSATINGNVSAGLSSIGSINCHGVMHSSTGVLTVTGDITSTISGVGVQGVNTAGTIRHFGNQVCAPDGKMGIHGYFYFVSGTNQQTFTPRVLTTNAARIFYTSNAVPSSITPSPSDVRNQTVYANGERVGSLAVAPPSLVAAGTPTDNTVGTAAITPESIRAALGLASANLDTQLAVLASDIDNIEVDNAAIASAVRSELTPELELISDIDEKSVDIQSSVAGVQSGVNAIGVSVSVLLSRITSGVATMFADLIQMITGSGTADAQWTTKALENVPGGSGSGARLVSITVLLDSVPQQSALVRLTNEDNSAETYLDTTDTDGLAQLSVNDGTWLVSITKAGAFFTGATLEVNGNETQSYSMTANPAISASDPGKITGYWLCLSQLGVPESGVTVTLTAMSLPPNSTGLILDSASRSVTTGADGVASFANLIPGVRYKVKRNSGREFYFVCPDYQATPVDLASFIGT